MKKFSVKQLGVIIVATAFTFIFMFRPVSAAIAFRNVATVNNGAGTTSVNIPKPTGTVANDVLIAHIAARGGTGTTITAPSGWVLINSTDLTTVLKSSTYYKVATGSEGSTYTFTLSVARQAIGIISTYSGVNTTTPIDVQNVQTNGSSTTLTAPAVTTTSSNDWVIASFSHATTTTLSAGSGMSLRGQDASSSNATAGLQDAVQASPGSTGTKTMTAAAASTSIGHTIALKPASSSSPVSQVAFRFFRNIDRYASGYPMGAINANTIITAAQPLRLRINLGVNGGSMTTSNSYTLQYAARSTGDNSCDSAFSGETYADVGSATPISFYSGNGLIDGGGYSKSEDDPVRSGILAKGQKYESANPLTVNVNVSSGNDSLWDIALTSVGVTDGSVYCLRVVDASTGVLGGYTVIPQITIDTLTVSQSNYRWFANANSLAPGSPLVAQDTAVTLNPFTPVRLRQRLGIDSGTLYPAGGDFKLQFAEKVGSCDTAFTGETYADMPTLSMVTTSDVTRSVNTTGSTTHGLWSNTSNAVNSDNEFAHAALLTTGGELQHLQVTADPPTIPPNSTIEGFRVGIGGYYSGDTSMNGQLIINGVSKGSLRPLPQTPYVINVQLAYAGSPKDLWGATWSASELNAASAFGIEIIPFFTNAYGGASYNLDDTFMEIYYTSYPTSPGTIFYRNTSPDDESTISSSGNDPTNARTVVYQRYQESQPFTNGSDVPNGQDGLWDFVIAPNDSAAGRTFCLRTVKSGGGLLDTYSFIPEITILPATANQTRGGGGVLNGTKSKLIW